MKVGDVLVFLGTYPSGNDASFTYGKHYVIYKITDHKEWRSGHIYDNHGHSCYFKESEATDNEWKYLKDIRKQKILKLNENRK